MSATSISVQGFEQFGELAQLIHDATQGEEVRAKTRHERFNLFTTLLLPHDEVRLHTRFLQCLFDPEGYHDCGDIFLNLFFEVLTESPAVDHEGAPVSFTPLPPKTAWTVENEASRGQFGQIDLLLESDVLRIALENKIYAVEQENQLARYTEYLGQKSTPRLVIYLTLDGKFSDTHNGAPYLRISYAHHILRWLDKCIWETVRITSINQTLIQYRELVRNLTGQTLATTAMKTIADFIQQHPDIIRYRTQLNVGIDAVRAGFLDSIANGVSEKLRSDGFVVSAPNQRKMIFGLAPNAALVVTPRPTSVLSSLGVAVWIENISSYQTLGVGLKVPDGYGALPDDSRRILDQMNQLLNEESGAGDSREPRPNEAWPTGWLKIANPSDDTQLADFLDAKSLDVVVAEFCTKIYGHIATLERAYVQASAQVSKEAEG